VVDGKPYLAFCSNDYLALPTTRNWSLHCAQARSMGAGAGAAHLVSGISILTINSSGNSPPLSANRCAAVLHRLHG